MTTWLWLKSLHQATALVSISGFVLRLGWVAREHRLLRHRLTRILPHINDTLFLATGIGLAATLQQYPITHAWLTAKLAGLLVYIVLGVLAIRPGRSRPVRLGCGLAAVLVFGWIVSVAWLKHPAGALRLLLN